MEKYIDYHSTYCFNNKHSHSFCIGNPQRVIVYLKTKFHLITYHNCAWYDRIDLVKKIIENSIEKMKLFDKYEIYRGYEIEKDIKEFRIRNKNLRKKVMEVNFIYSNCTRKKWAITNEVNFFDALCNNEMIYENYKKTSEFLKDNQYDWLQEDLTELWHMNHYHLSDYECYKTIDHLIKSINTYGNN